MAPSAQLRSRVSRTLKTALQDTMSLISTKDILTYIFCVSFPYFLGVAPFVVTNWKPLFLFANSMEKQKLDTWKFAIRRTMCHCKHFISKENSTFHAEQYQWIQNCSRWSKDDSSVGTFEEKERKVAKISPGSMLIDTEYYSRWQTIFLVSSTLINSMNTLQPIKRYRKRRETKSWLNSNIYS